MHTQWGWCMTTNVFDSNAGLICTDSRWSMRCGSWLLYVDDVNYHKIALRSDHAVMFAGQSLRIDEWKTWLRLDPFDVTRMPSTEGVVVCLIRLSTGRVAFERGVDVEREGAYFAGSGSRAAVECWMLNRCAQTAVQSAIGVDACSGGEVKFYDVKNGQSNLSPAPQRLASLADVHTAIETRGTVMNISSTRSSAPIPFAKLKSLGIEGCTEQDQADLLQLVASVGDKTLMLSAPCDGMYEAWTDDEVQRCRDAFREAFC
jgi:hypothetical protein